MGESNKNFYAPVKKSTYVVMFPLIEAERCIYAAVN